MAMSTPYGQPFSADAPAAGHPAQRSQFGAALAGRVNPFAIFVRIREHLRCSGEKSRLHRLSDRDLADMRLGRWEIGEIYDADFEHRRRN